MDDDATALVGLHEIVLKFRDSYSECRPSCPKGKAINRWLKNTYSPDPELTTCTCGYEELNKRLEDWDTENWEYSTGEG